MANPYKDIAPEDILRMQEEAGMNDWYMATPTLRALSKLINLYFFFKVGYDAGIANGLNEYVLTDEELESLQSVFDREKQTLKRN